MVATANASVAPPSKKVPAVASAQAVAWFHALSDATRLDIVEQLLRGERCVCELTEDLDAAQSRLSFHLKTLKDAGLVADRREGRWVYYAINHDTFAAIERFVAALAHAPRPARRDDPCCG